jgi:hypothetical protein
MGVDSDFVASSGTGEDRDAPPDIGRLSVPPRLRRCWSDARGPLESSGLRGHAFALHTVGPDNGVLLRDSISQLGLDLFTGADHERALSDRHAVLSKSHLYRGCVAHVDGLPCVVCRNALEQERTDDTERVLGCAGASVGTVSTGSQCHASGAVLGDDRVPEGDLGREGRDLRGLRLELVDVDLVDAEGGEGQRDVQRNAPCERASQKSDEKRGND